MYIFKGANLYQKVGQNEAGQGILGFIRQLLPRTYFLKVILAEYEFSGLGRKSGSAYALVDLVSLAPLLQIQHYQSGHKSQLFPQSCLDRPVAYWSTEAALRQ